MLSENLTNAHFMRILGRFRGIMEKFKYSWLSAYEERVTVSCRKK